VAVVLVAVVVTVLVLLVLGSTVDKGRFHA